MTETSIQEEREKTFNGIVHNHIMKIRKKKMKKTIKNEIIKDARILFELEGDCYEPIKIELAFNRDFIIYELNGDKYKTPLLNECLAIIRDYI